MARTNSKLFQVYSNGNLYNAYVEYAKCDANGDQIDTTYVKSATYNAFVSNVANSFIAVGSAMASLDDAKYDKSGGALSGSAYPSVTNTLSLGLSNKRWSTGYINQLVASNVYASGGQVAAEHFAFVGSNYYGGILGVSSGTQELYIDNSGKTNIIPYIVEVQQIEQAVLPTVAPASWARPFLMVTTISKVYTLGNVLYAGGGGLVAAEYTANYMSVDGNGGIYAITDTIHCEYSSVTRSSIGYYVGA